MNDAKEAQDVLLGVYRSTIEEGMYGHHLSIYFSMGTDISQVEGSTTENFRILPTNAYSASQAEVQTSWASLYSGIYNANDFLERISVKWIRIMNPTNNWQQFILPKQELYEHCTI